MNEEDLPRIFITNINKNVNSNDLDLGDYVNHADYDVIDDVLDTHLRDYKTFNLRGVKQTRTDSSSTTTSASTNPGKLTTPGQNDSKPKKENLKMH